MDDKTIIQYYWDRDERAVTESDDGTFLIRRYILDNDITDYYLDVYDSSLKLMSEKQIIDKNII